MAIVTEGETWSRSLVRMRTVLGGLLGDLLRRQLAQPRAEEG